MTNTIRTLPWSALMAVIGGLGLLVGSAQAAIVTYDDRASFEAAAGSVSVETFNGFVADTSFSPGPLDAGAFTLANVGVDFNERNYIDVPPLVFADQNVNGTALMSMFTFFDNNVVTLTFDSPITAFGADFEGLNDRPNEGQLTQLLLDGVAVSISIGDPNGIRFFGAISDTPFTVVSFVGIRNDGYAADDVTFAAAVPEPMSLALFGLGATGLLLRRRRTA